MNINYVYFSVLAQISHRHKHCGWIIEAVCFFKCPSVMKSTVAGATEYLYGEGHCNYGVIVWELQLKDCTVLVAYA